MKKEPKAKRMSRLKKKCHDAWSKVVRTRDGACVRCGATKSLAAHHWIISAARSLATRYDPINGCALCYGCHIHVIHKEATWANAHFLMERMLKAIPVELIDSVIEMSGKENKPHTESELEDILKDLEDMYEEMVRT